MDQAMELQTRIEELTRQQTETVAKLRRSLVLQELWPEAFEHGSVRSQVVGNVRRGELTFTVTRGDGSSRSFELAAVPVLLWPEAVLEDVRGRPQGKYFQLLRKAGG